MHGRLVDCSMINARQFRKKMFLVGYLVIQREQTREIVLVQFDWATSQISNHFYSLFSISLSSLTWVLTSSYECLCKIVARVSTRLDSTQLDTFEDGVPIVNLHSWNVGQKNTTMKCNDMREPKETSMEGEPKYATLTFPYNHII